MAGLGDVSKPEAVEGGGSLQLIAHLKCFCSVAQHDLGLLLLLY